MKKMVIVGLIFLLVSSASAREYSHRLQDMDMSFAWQVEGEWLHLQLQADTEGWLGIGFNPSAKMKDANIVLGYVKDKELVLSDEYGSSAVRHLPDAVRGGTVDYRFAEGESIDGVTTIRFSIPMDSRDASDKIIEANAETVVLLAYGEKKGDLRRKHSYRSSYKVNLQTGKYQKIR